MPRLSDESNSDDEDETLNAEIDNPQDIGVPTVEHVALGEHGYTDSWSAISSMQRTLVHYKCEKCGIDLNERRALLHVHHLDHNRLNNDDWNLIAVCILCHSTFRNHGHLLQREKEEDLLFLKSLQLSRG